MNKFKLLGKLFLGTVVIFLLVNISLYLYCYITPRPIINKAQGYYLYDTKENSVQRYDTTMLDNITQTKDKFFSVVLVLSCVCFLTMLFLLIEVNRDNKRQYEE